MEVPRERIEVIEPAKKPAPKKKSEPPEPDAPDKDWSDEEKADWEASRRQRERMSGEITSSIVDKLKDIFFNEEEGGEVTEEEEEAIPVEAAKHAPFWEKQIFGRKT